MFLEELRTYCLAKPGVTEHFPFDNRTLVFKVMNKMFALCDVEDFESINLKCDPDQAIVTFDFANIGPEDRPFNES